MTDIPGQKRALDASNEDKPKSPNGCVKPTKPNTSGVLQKIIDIIDKNAPELIQAGVYSLLSILGYKLLKPVFSSVGTAIDSGREVKCQVSAFGASGSITISGKAEAKAAPCKDTKAVSCPDISRGIS
ncbi:hypothetical protein [Nitratidesulfovibrio vulgaris]|uniref:hypothetical protein n=1 Tax=Nitratidesulfovibrio vulgaris TaxID=881 RepID=UPI0013E0C822|nr:hypothetical protein [Nitratidesulfovibrio vulgaris]